LPKGEENEINPVATEGDDTSVTRRDHTQYYYKCAHVGQKKRNEATAIASDLLPPSYSPSHYFLLWLQILDLCPGRLGDHAGKCIDVVGRRSPETTLVMHGVVVGLVLHDCRWGEAQYPADTVPDPILRLNILVVLVPDAKDIFVAPHTEDTAADPILNFELVSNNAHDKVLPEPVRNALAQSNDPLSAVRIERVFPYRALYPTMEEKIIRSRSQDRRRIQMSL